MGKNKYILPYEAEAIFETVVDKKQMLAVIENGNSLYMDMTLKQCIACNENYYGTNIKIAKKRMKDIIGTGHAAPYIFGDMIWVPLVTQNRTDTMYVALHHFKGIEENDNKQIKVVLSSGMRIRLKMTRASAIQRFGTAGILKNSMDLRKNLNYNPNNLLSSPYEIVKEEGNVYFTRKRRE
ncbi:MAG: competence protein ComK [Solibacillus sp.]